MGRKTKTPFNHDAITVSEACGTDIDKAQSTMNDLINSFNEGERPSKLSQIAEAVENTFNKRELAIIVASDIVGDSVEASKQDFAATMSAFLSSMTR